MTSNNAEYSAPERPVQPQSAGRQAGANQGTRQTNPQGTHEDVLPGLHAQLGVSHALRNKQSAWFAQLLQWVSAQAWTAHKRRSGLAGIAPSALQQYSAETLERQSKQKWAGKTAGSAEPQWDVARWRRLHAEVLAARKKAETRSKPAPKAAGLVRLIAEVCRQEEQAAAEEKAAHAAAKRERTQPGGVKLGTVKTVKLSTAKLDAVRSKIELLVISEMVWHEAAHVLMALQLGFSPRVDWSGPAWAIEASYIYVPLHAPPTNLAVIGLAPWGVEVGCGSGRLSQPSPEDLQVLMSNLPGIHGSRAKQSVWAVGAVAHQLRWKARNQRAIDEVAVQLITHMDQPYSVNPGRVPAHWLTGATQLRQDVYSSVIHGWSS